LGYDCWVFQIFEAHFLNRLSFRAKFCVNCKFSLIGGNQPARDMRYSDLSTLNYWGIFYKN